MSHIPLFLKKLVIRRANNHCEYCHLAQQGQEATFHVDHVIPLAAGGETIAENLALACVSCSLRKGAREFAVDEGSKNTTRIYNPRNEIWEEHFRWDGVLLKGLTAKGKATVRL